MPLHCILQQIKCICKYAVCLVHHLPPGWWQSILAVVSVGFAAARVARVVVIVVWLECLLFLKFSWR